MDPVHREATCNSRVGPFDVQRKGFGRRRRGGNTRAESDLILKNNILSVTRHSFKKIAKIKFLFFTSTGFSRVPISNTLFGRF